MDGGKHGEGEDPRNTGIIETLIALKIIEDLSRSSEMGEDLF